MSLGFVSLARLSLEMVFAKFSWLSHVSGAEDSNSVDSPATETDVSVQPFVLSTSEARVDTVALTSLNGAASSWLNKFSDLEMSKLQLCDCSMLFDSLQSPLLSIFKLSFEAILT